MGSLATMCRAFTGTSPRREIKQQTRGRAALRRFIAALFLALVPLAQSIGPALAQTVTITEYPIPTADSGPGHITPGPDGALWFTEEGANQIERLDPKTGTITRYPLGRGTYPVDITAGPGRDLWFTHREGEATGWIDSIGRLNSASGKITWYRLPPAPNVGRVAWGIAADPAGALWFAEYYGNKIGQIAVDKSAACLSTRELRRSVLEAESLDRGAKDSLDAKLWNIEKAVCGGTSATTAAGFATGVEGVSGGTRTSGTSHAACNQLDAFINEVKAQSGKGLTVELANQMIQDANQIKAALGCN